MNDITKLSDKGLKSYLETRLAVAGIHAEKIKKDYRPVGATDPTVVGRTLASVHRDLFQGIEDGKFYMERAKDVLRQEGKFDQGLRQNLEAALTLLLESLEIISPNDMTITPGAMDRFSQILNGEILMDDNTAPPARPTSGTWLQRWIPATASVPNTGKKCKPG